MGKLWAFTRRPSPHPTLELLPQTWRRSSAPDSTVASPPAPKDTLPEPSPQISSDETHAHLTFHLITRAEAAIFLPGYCLQSYVKDIVRHRCSHVTLSGLRPGDVPAITEVVENSHTRILREPGPSYGHPQMGIVASGGNRAESTSTWSGRQIALRVGFSVDYGLLPDLADFFGITLASFKSVSQCSSSSPKQVAEDGTWSDACG